MTDIMKLAAQWGDARIMATRDRATNDEVLQARDALQSAIEALQAESASMKQIAELNAHIAIDLKAEREALQSKLDAMGKGEPVAWIKYLIGAEAKPNGQCYDIVFVACDGYEPLYAAPKALAPEPLTDKEDWDVRGILASKLRVFHRTTEAEAEELISLFSSMKSRTPLTQPEVVEAFCNTPHNVQYVSVFDAGVRFAEKHHGIGVTP